MQQPLGKLDGGDYENLRHKRSLGQQSLPRDFPNANMSPEYKDSCTKLGFFFFLACFCFVFANCKNVSRNRRMAEELMTYPYDGTM
jgi:hypothetical protein